MDEKPKSIWKKSWTGWRGLLLGWLILMAVLLVCYLFLLMATGTPVAKSDNELRLFGVIGIGVTVIFLLATFIRWLFCWRNFKRFLFGCACFATLIALFYAEEDWRGKHDWEKFKRQWEAKGEKFDFTDFIPPPVPDDQNFAMAPIFDTTDKLASRKWRNEHRNQHPDSRGNPWDTNLVDPLQMEISDDSYNSYNHGDQPTNGYWAKATETDLSGWQNYYRQLATKTNEFPIAPQPQSPAPDVLLALSKYDSTIEALREASQRPDSRFPLDYDDEDPAEILLPHLADLKRCCLVLQLRAIAELQNGQSDKALADVKLALALTDSIRTEPFIISQLVRFAYFQITLQTIYEGLAGHKWSDAQLAELDAELSKLDFLADYEYSTRSELAAHAKIIDWLEQKRSRFFTLINMFNDDEKVQLNNSWLAAEIYLMPRGWFYQSDIVMSDVHQKWIQPMVDDARQTVSPELARQATAAVSALKPIGINFFARLLLPELGSYAEKVAHGQTAANMARVAIALERYRLAHGEFPESLDELAPQFMEKIPHDVIGGQPLHYRRTDDGQFILYSVGWNETDDGGVVAHYDPYNKNGTPNINEGDWVWHYPQK